MLSSSSLFFDPDEMPVPKKRKKKKVKQEESTDVVEVPKGEITREPQLNLFSDFYRFFTSTPQIHIKCHHPMFRTEIDGQEKQN